LDACFSESPRVEGRQRTIQTAKRMAEPAAEDAVTRTAQYAQKHLARIASFEHRG